MDKITRQQALEILLKDNPQNDFCALTTYLDAFMDYQEAQSNISANGSIVMHPRTGSPISNPYLKIKSTSLKTMSASKGLLRATRLWRRASLS